MKINLTLAAVAIALAGIFGDAYPASAPAISASSGFSFHLGADPGTMTFRRVSAANFNETPYGVSHYGHAAGSDTAGIFAGAAQEFVYGNDGGLFASPNRAVGPSYFRRPGSAAGTQDRQDQVVANTGHVAESNPLALILAGLGLMGFIAHRRMRQQ
jgi:hypothetical protein